MHVGITVHVATHPTAEADDGRQLELIGIDPVILADRLSDFFVEIRDDAIEHLGEKEQHVFALVGDREPLPRMIFGLPERGELDAQSTHGGALLGGRERRIQSIVEQLREAQLLAQDRPTRRLGRVRHEHGHDVQRADQGE